MSPRGFGVGAFFLNSFSPAYFPASSPNLFIPASSACVPAFPNAFFVPSEAAFFATSEPTFVNISKKPSLLAYHNIRVILYVHYTSFSSLYYVFVLLATASKTHIGSVLFRTSSYTGAKQASRVPTGSKQDNSPHNDDVNAVSVLLESELIGLV